jgi:hypothetical protein
MPLIPVPVERPYLRNVPRCQHLKLNGTECQSPALRRNRFCFFHKRFQEEQIKLNTDRRRRRPVFILPVLEDADSIQVSLMQTMRLIVSGQIDPKSAALLLYALQTASFNLRHTTFEPDVITDVVIDRNTMDRSCVGCSQWVTRDFEDEEDEEDEEATAEAPVQAAAATKENLRRPNPAVVEAHCITPKGNLATVASPPTAKQPPAPEIKSPPSLPPVPAARAEALKAQAARDRDKIVRAYYAPVTSPPVRPVQPAGRTTAAPESPHPPASEKLNQASFHTTES